MSEGGLEPPRPCGHQPLKLARLPIPPLRLACDSEERPESVARATFGSVPGGPARYGPGSGGVVLFVDSGTRTAQYWAYQRRLLLVGVATTPPTLRLHTRALGSVKSGRATMSSHSCVSAAA